MKTFYDKINKNFDKKFIFAIGGGAIIDKAKIYAKKHNKYCIAIPTTGAGASETTHSVVWGKTKKNIQTDKPLTIIPPFKIELSKTTRRNTCLDMVGHLVDYLNVCSDNEIVEAGIFMGKLIEKHSTNLTHKASYPLTLKGMPHGEAVGKILKEVFKDEKLFTNS
jgi:alcohol dehydrogenase class IV